MLCVEGRRDIDHQGNSVRAPARVIVFALDELAPS